MTDLEREAIRKKRGLSELSQKQKQILSDYLQNSPYKQIDKDLENEGGFYGAKADDFGAMLEGRGKFRGSDRYASNLGEGLDSVFGAPARVSIDRLQEGNIKAALVDAMAQVGRDPKEAPTGVDIASKVTDNPYLGAGLATAVDVAGLPIPVPVGTVGTVKKLGAQGLLDDIATAEKAVALKGAEREQYLKALDEVYGDRSKRRADMGFGKKPWYHGTGADIDKFDVSRGQTNAGGPTGKQAIHFAKDPKLANQYAYEQTPQFYKDGLKKDNELMNKAIGKSLEDKYGFPFKDKASAEELAQLALDKKAFSEFAEKERPLYEGRYKALPEGIERESGNNVIPVNLKTREMVGQELDGGSVGYDEAEFLKTLRKEGKYGGAVFKNAYDNLNHVRHENPGMMVPSTDIAAVFNPKDIRSVNAAFDPRFKDSPLLLAAETLKPSLEGQAIGKAIEERKKRRK